MRSIKIKIKKNTRHRDDIQIHGLIHTPNINTCLDHSFHDRRCLAEEVEVCHQILHSFQRSLRPVHDQQLEAQIHVGLRLLCEDPSRRRVEQISSRKRGPHQLNRRVCVLESLTKLFELVLMQCCADDAHTPLEQIQ